MHLVTYRHGNSPRLGALFQAWIVDLQRAYQAYLHSTGHRSELHPTRTRYLADMMAFLQAGEEAWEVARRVLFYVMEQAGKPGWAELSKKRCLFPIAKTFLYPPIPKPEKIICIGSNYPDGKPGCTPSEYPIIFLKPASALVGSETPIQIPPVTHDVAYEGELVVVIGSRAKYLAKERALDCVAGYTQANDVGARDLEKRTSQWTSGKLMDTFCPLGPALVTRDEVPDPRNLPVVTLLNGDVVQRGNTRDMFFDVPELVSYVSQLTTLAPGDLILTGSPKTVDGQTAPVFSLQPSDCIEIMIGTLGVLRSPVVAEGTDGWKA